MGFYVLPSLYIDRDYTEFLSYDQQVTLACTGYICATLFFFMLCFAVHNVIRFLLMQGKWKVFALSSFYCFAVVCLMFRTYDCICVAQIAIHVNVVSLLLPPVFKIGIGLVQVNNMAELAIRVKQGIVLLVQAREGSFMGQ